MPWYDESLGAGIVFFIANTAFGAFIKFNEYWNAAVVMCAGLAPAIVFCAYLYMRWLPYLLTKHIVKPAVRPWRLSERPWKGFQAPL